MKAPALICLGLVTLALAACGGGSSPGLPQSLAHLYVYDTKNPLHEVDRGLANHNFPVRIHDVSFSDSKGGGADAYLCVPPGKGPFAGAVIVPGSGAGRADLLYQAVQLAARGAVTMTVLTPFIHGMENEPNGLAEARFYKTHFEDNVIGIRRAFDLLERRPDVDKHRLGLAGYSLGASISSVVSGVDLRPIAVVLVAPPSHPHFIPPFQGQTAVEAAKILAPVDPKRFLRHAKAHLFVEMARRDQIEIPPEQRAVLKAVGPKARVKWYPTGHEMNLQAWNDLVSWLGDELHLGPLPKYARSAAKS
jgi:dienelactone hydrolase